MFKNIYACNADNSDKENSILSMNLAQMYIPIQTISSIYPPSEGLEKGTIFPELYMPYCKHNNC